MLFASYYEGAAVSTVRLGEGKQGDTTSVVDVRVRPGIGSLYAQAVTFVMAPGVPPPSGDLGHSRLHH